MKMLLQKIPIEGFGTKIIDLNLAFISFNFDGRKILSHKKVIVELYHVN